MAESTRTTVGFVKQSSLVVGKANALKIISEATYRVAATMLSGFKALGKEIDIHHDPIIVSQRDSLAVARQQKALYRDPVTRAIEIVKDKSLAWDTEQEKIAKEEQQRLQAIKTKAAADERASNEEIARDLEKAKNLEAAAQVRSIPVVEEKVLLDKRVEIPGQKFKMAYGADVNDLRALVKAWLDGKVDIGAIQANEVLLGQMARNEQSRKEVKTYPGVNVWEKKILASI